MTLYDAFIALQPIAPHASATERTRLQLAGKSMLDALNAQARLVMSAGRFSPSDRDTAVQTVLLRMIRSGPRGARAGDPTTDEGIRRWLARAVRNASMDLIRRQRRHVPADPKVLDRQAQRHHGPGSGGTRRVSERRIDDALKAARRVLFDDVIPAVALRKSRSSKAAGTRFLENVQTLRDAVAAGGTVVDLARNQLAAELGATAVTRKLLSSRRTTLDKRFQRVREHVIEEINRRRQSQRISRRQRAVLLLLVQQTLYMQRRNDAVITRAHRESPSGAN